MDMKRLYIDSATKVPHDCFHASQGGCRVYIARFGNRISVAADGFSFVLTLREFARHIKKLSKGAEH